MVLLLLSACTRTNPPVASSNDESHKRVTPDCNALSACAPDEQDTFLDLDAGVLTDGAIVEDGGWLTPPTTVAAAPTYISRAAWFAAEIHCWVTKLDLFTRKEVGRYPCVLQTPDPATGQPNQGGLTLDFDWTDSERFSPSRTAIDQNFDAYVANRDIRIPTFSKIQNNSILRNADGDPVDMGGTLIPSGGTPVVLCPDRDGDGTLRTSWDANYDGVIDQTDPQEFPGQKDDCVLWSAQPTSPDTASNYRTMVVGLPDAGETVGHPWVFSREIHYGHKIDKDSGAELLNVDKTNFSGDGRRSNGFRPYGGAVGPDGRIWLVDRGHVTQSPSLEEHTRRRHRSYGDLPARVGGSRNRRGHLCKTASRETERVRSRARQGRQRLDKLPLGMGVDGPARACQVLAQHRHLGSLPVPDCEVGIGARQ